MRPGLTRRQVTASLALSWLWGDVPDYRVSAQERGKLSAAAERIKRLERQLEELRQTLEIPGVSAAIVKDQKLLWVKGLGSADVEDKIPATPETNYRIASLTKPFASTLLMQLVEQGTLDLDEPMAKYSPEFRERCGRGQPSRCATSSPTPRTIRRAIPTGMMATGLLPVRCRRSSVGRTVPRAARVRTTSTRSAWPTVCLDRIFWSSRAKSCRVLGRGSRATLRGWTPRLAKPYRLDGTATVRASIHREGSAQRPDWSPCPRPCERRYGDRSSHPRRAETQERAWMPMSTTEGRKLRTVSAGSFSLTKERGWFGPRLLAEWCSSLYFEAAGTEDRVDPPREQRRAERVVLAQRRRCDTLGIRQQLPKTFRAEESLGRVLPDPPWSQSSDRFNAEIERIATQTGSYRYEAERASHELVDRAGWMSAGRLPQSRPIMLSRSNAKDATQRAALEALTRGRRGWIDLRPNGRSKCTSTGGERMSRVLVDYLTAIGWGIVSAVSLAVSLGILLRVFDWLTPINEWEEVGKREHLGRDHHVELSSSP